MLKGVNKLIVEINNPESEYFERAIFFVRPKKVTVGTKRLNEHADLFLSQAETPAHLRRGSRLMSFAKYALSVLGGCALTIVILYCMGMLG